MDSTANNYNADATVDDGSCTFDTTEPEPEPVVDDTTNQTAAEDNVTKDEIAEVVDEVPGFGLLSAVAAIGVVLLLRRRL
jgi:hypothetical protein